MTLLDNRKLKSCKRIILDKEIKVNTVNSHVYITEQIITNLPVEFNEKATMEWKLMNFENKSFDAIIGSNFLNAIGGIVNMRDKYLEINNNKIPFCNSKIKEKESINSNDQCPFPYNEIHTMEYSSVEIGELLHKNLNKEEGKLLTEFLRKNKDLFYTDGQKLSATTQTTHKIRTKNDTPIFTKIYRYPKVHEIEINKQISEMLENGIIRKSISPYNSPVWVVPKKTDNSGVNKWRMVIDYRKLNENTVEYKYPLPNIEDILDKLGRAQYFSVLDLAKGFHQILVDIKDIEKTAFSVPNGHYEFLRMPFGLRNAPASFQCMMNEILEGLINKICVVYMDDILIFSTSLTEHMINLTKIFERLRKYNLKIQVDKCEFLKRETKFLGHVITKDGLKPNEEKIKAIQKICIPKTTTEIKSFLGLTGYYRKFISDYARTALPMTKYLKKGTRIDVKDSQYIQSFETLKKNIMSPPVLAYPDFNKEFELTTDASNYAIGAVLAQDKHPITYISRTLNDHERNYSTTEKELLAIVWSIKYLRPYLYGRKFQLKSDHQPLKWLKTKSIGKDISGRLQRWILSLGEYDFDISYLKGSQNTIADYLSREIKDNEINHIDEEQELETRHSKEEELLDHFVIIEKAVNSYKQQIIVNQDYQGRKIGIRRINGNRKLVELSPNLLESPSFERKIKTVLEPKQTGIYCENDAIYNKLQQKLIKLFDKSLMTFHRCSYLAKEMKTEEETVEQVKLYHELETSHSGIEENFTGLKRYIFFPKLKNIVTTVVNNCAICRLNKYDRHPVKPKFKLTETPSDVNQIVHADLFFLNKLPFLSTIDKFSKRVTFTSIPNKNIESIHTALVQYISQHGKPIKFVMDNEFDQISINTLFNDLNIERHFTTPHSHTGNSPIERAHSSILDKIRCLKNGKQLSDLEKINISYKAVFYYNNAIQNISKKKPFEIQEGRVDKKQLYETFKEHKEKKISQLNKNREDTEKPKDNDYVVNPGRRDKILPKFKYKTTKRVHPVNIQRKRKQTRQISNNDMSEQERRHKSENKIASTTESVSQNTSLSVESENIPLAQLKWKLRKE